MGLHKGQTNAGSFKKGYSPWNKGKKGSIPWNKGKKELRKEVIEKMRLKRIGVKPWNWNKKRPEISGDKHPLWQGGKSGEKKLRLSKIDWKLKRKEILERDKFICQICKKIDKSRNLQIHHKIPYRISQDNSNDNLITLCNKCHKKEEWRIIKNEI